MGKRFFLSEDEKTSIRSLYLTEESEREDRKFVGEIYIDKDNRDYHYNLL